ncbi:MAG: flagellar biosynthesis anti-sigma factor FlgM [Desulfobaccales bacterium]|nr:flagellar biosynthesis anti-sigma factor FlgM [Desulfobaccales bacterium]
MDRNDSNRTYRKPGPPELDGADQPRPGAPGPEATDPSEDKARLMQKARQIVEQTPQVRPEKVATLKEAVRQGTYRINARRLANILIAKLLTER